MARRFEWATQRQHVRKIEKLRGEAFWSGCVAGGAVTVIQTADSDPTPRLAVADRCVSTTKQDPTISDFAVLS